VMMMKFQTPIQDIKMHTPTRRFSGYGFAPLRSTNHTAELNLYV